MMNMLKSIMQANRPQFPEVLVEIIDALLYNGNMNREQLLALDELAKWDIDRLNLAIEFGKQAEAIHEQENGLILLYDSTVYARIAH